MLPLFAPDYARENNCLQCIMDVFLKIDLDTTYSEVLHV